MTNKTPFVTYVLTYTLITALVLETVCINTHWVNEVHDLHENHLTVETHSTITQPTSGSLG